MDILPVLISSISVDVLLLVVGIYYLGKIRTRERELEKKENKVDTDYHQIVDSALAKERKILDDATNEADKIISDAKYINRTASEEVGKAMQKMVEEIQKEADQQAKNVMADYEAVLKQVSSRSLNEFQKINGELQDEMRKQINNFQDNLLPGLKKELEEYKQVRMQEADKLVRSVVSTAAQEILNKTINLEDHQDLVIRSLEKAKKEGVFD